MLQTSKAMSARELRHPEASNGLFDEDCGTASLEDVRRKSRELILQKLREAVQGRDTYGIIVLTVMNY